MCRSMYRYLRLRFLVWAIASSVGLAACNNKGTPAVGGAASRGDDAASPSSLAPAGQGAPGTGPDAAFATAPPATDADSLPGQARDAGTTPPAPGAGGRPTADGASANDVTTPGSAADARGPIAADAPGGSPDPASAAGEDRDGWRTWYGSWSYLAGKPSGKTLVDSLTKGRRFWKSEEPVGHPKDSLAGAASPIVAGGVVFQAYLTASSDVAVAIDAQTGKTRWKKSFDGGGQAQQTAQPFYATPAVFAGVLVMVGGQGKVYGLAAEDGRMLWEFDTGAKASGGGNSPFAAGVSYAGGVALVPGYDRTPAGQSLHALDARTGQKLWTLPGALGTNAMAVRWTYGGRDYVIASNMLGELRCLDPRTGQPLWMQTGAGANQSTVAVGDNHLLGNVTPSSGEFTTLGAFRLDDKGATKVWQYPNGGKYSYVAILDKHAYINFERNNSGDQTGEGLHVLDLASGRVIKHHEIHLRSRAIVWAADGRVVLGHDGSHGLERYIMFGTAPDVQPYNIDWVGLPVPVGQGFIFSMSHAYVDGIVYLRGPDGVYALDMRAQ